MNRTLPQAIVRLLDTDVVAATPALLGTVLTRGALRARIVETEAYAGDIDPGSHSYRGRTDRNRVMFGKAGLAYVYFTYGSHWMLNVTANPEGVAGGILIRAAQPIAGLAEMFALRPTARKPQDLLSGPGKLAQAFGIDRSLYGVDLLDPASDLRLEPGDPAVRIVTSARIGLAMGKGHDTPWRFIDADSMEWASKPWPVSGV